MSNLHNQGNAHVNTKQLFRVRGKLRRILLELYGFLVSSLSVLPVIIPSQRFFFVLPLTSTFEMFLPYLISDRSKVASYICHTKKPVTYSSPSCRGGTGAEESISSPQTKPGIHTTRQVCPFLQRHATSASGGSTEEWLKNELTSESNMCPSLFPASRRLPTTSFALLIAPTQVVSYVF